MKQSLLFIAILLCVNFSLRAQSKTNVAWGKITDQELNMTFYDKDTSASAVVLYELSDVRFDINSSGIMLLKSYSTRIKILKDEGKSFADVEVPYHQGGYRRDQSVERISAIAYNMVDGKVVKTQLSPKYIFRENVGGERFLLKFSIPEVKVGTVIEYRYDFRSDFFYIIPDVEIQRSIPVAYVKSTIAIPEYFAVNFNMKGYNKIDTDKKRESSPLGFGMDVFTFQVRDMPAIKSVPYVWCMSDFSSMISAEFSAMQFPGAARQNFATSWVDVDLAIEKANFAEALRFPNPYKAEVDLIKLSAQSDRAKIRQIHRLVMSKIKWNEQFRLFARDIRGAIKISSGTSADLNFVLISALRAAGYKADPILLNPRPFGRLPYACASYEGINAFVVLVSLESGDIICLDATDPLSDLDVLPPYLAVDRARIYKSVGDDGWVNLSALLPNKIKVNVKGAISPTGLITAQSNAVYTNMDAYMLADRYNDAKDEDEFLERTEARHGIKITEYDLSTRDQYPLAEKIDFTRQMSASSSRIYVDNILLNFIPRNPFKDKERAYPIEFSYCTHIEFRCVLDLPDGYKLGEMPENIVAVIPNGAQFSAVFTKVGEMALRVDVSYSLERMVFLSEEYQAVVDFFSKVFDVHSGLLTLEKI